MRKTAWVVVASIVSLSAFASSESEPTSIFVNAGLSSFWHTATNATLTVPVEFPVGATSAKLVVSGSGYRHEYDDIVASTQTVTLPLATSLETEDVYDLTLSFVGSDEVRTAKLGLVRGYGAADEGTTRCLVNVSEAKWRRVKGTHVVLPIASGVATVLVDGEAVDPGLNGDQGWYALQSGERALPATLSLSADDGTEEYEGSVCFRPLEGLILLFK